MSALLYNVSLVFVMCFRWLLFRQNLFLVAPEIILPLTDLLENETNNIQFVCQAIGVPVPHIRWFYNGVMVNLSDSSKYNSSSLCLNESIIESALNIINAESSDIGIYACQAENIIGTDQTFGVLTLNGMHTINYTYTYVCLLIILYVHVMSTLMSVHTC